MVVITIHANPEGLVWIGKTLSAQPYEVGLIGKQNQPSRRLTSSQGIREVVGKHSEHMVRRKAAYPNTQTGQTWVALITCGYAFKNPQERTKVANFLTEMSVSFVSLVSIMGVSPLHAVLLML
jgi:hypothetical protein